MIGISIENENQEAKQLWWVVPIINEDTLAG